MKVEVEVHSNQVQVSLLGAVQRCSAEAEGEMQGGALRSFGAPTG